MDKNLKKNLLINFARSILADPAHSGEFKYLLDRLSLTEHDAVKTYVNYDLDIFAYENEIYESVPMRLVLYMHNVLKGSWHIERQQLLLDLIKKHSPNTLADVGFGVPGRYIKEYVFKAKKQVTLLDCFPSAFAFAKALLSLWNNSWQGFVKFKDYNMDSFKFPGPHAAYIFWDSIEHTKDPSKYLDMLVSRSPSNSVFLFSLPIGPSVPVHFMSWDSEDIAENWLGAHGLKVLSRKTVHPNPRIDLFAEGLKRPFYNLIVDCKKL